MLYYTAHQWVAEPNTSRWRRRTLPYANRKLHTQGQNGDSLYLSFCADCLTNCRGKAARRIQNARAKAKLRGRKRTTTGSLSNAKPLPQSLITLAALPLPNSSLFHQACSGSELIDESDVLQWEKPPPYDSPPPPNSPDEDRFTRNLADVMHGRQYRLEQETRARHAQIFATANAEVILQDIQAAERTLMGKWNELNEYVLHMQSCERHRVMAGCYVQWQARKIFNYRREADLIIRGLNPYK